MNRQSFYLYIVKLYHPHIQISGDRIIAINPHPKDKGSKMIMHMTGAMNIK